MLMCVCNAVSEKDTHLYHLIGTKCGSCIKVKEYNMLDIARLKSKEIKYIRFHLGVDSLAGESTYRIGRHKDLNTRVFYDYKQNVIVLINKSPDRVMIVPMQQVICFEFLHDKSDEIVKKVFDEG